MKRPPLQIAGAIALFGAVMTLGCGGDATSPNNGSVKDYFTAVQAVVQPSASTISRDSRTLGRVTIRRQTAKGLVAASPSSPSISAVYHAGSPPSGSGPAAQGVAESTPLDGQPFRFGISASENFTSIYISVAGADGYWQIDLGNSASAAELVLTLADHPRSENFSMQTAVGSAGSAGNATTTSLSAAALDDADISVTLTWDSPSDVDLHVIDPKGQEIYWNNRVTPEGGRLNLDSNPACQLDHVNSEIISWPTGTAPHGTYTVVVHYYADCGVPSTNYLVKYGRSPGYITVLQPAPFTGPSDDSRVDTVDTFMFPR